MLANVVTDPGANDNADQCANGGTFVGTHGAHKFAHCVANKRTHGRTFSSADEHAHVSPIACSIAVQRTVRGTFSVDDDGGSTGK